MAGSKLYRSQCASCHGLEGAGAGAAPSLTSGSFRHGGSDEAFFRVISKGVPGTAMPGFAFTGLQIWQLVTHVRSLGIVHGASQAKGDPQSGATVFRADCSGCHMVKGEGGLRAPDLTWIGSRRTIADLQKALLDPDAEVAPQYWSVIAKTSAGQMLRGIRLNEDTYSIQLRLNEGKLVSLPKQDLQEVEMVRRSPMPSFANKLSATQLADVTAYLVSLRGPK